MIPTTTERVVLHTHKDDNDCISERTRQNVSHYASATPQTLDARLRHLDREWDVERVTALAGGLGLLAGGGLTLAFGTAWVAVPVLIAGFMLLHAVVGWSPLLPPIRKLGFRTACEISYERYALKALRGDFRRLAGVTTAHEREELSRFEGEGGAVVPDYGPDASDPEIINEVVRAAKP